MTKDESRYRTFLENTVAVDFSASKSSEDSLTIPFLLIDLIAKDTSVHYSLDAAK